MYLKFELFLILQINGRCQIVICNIYDTSAQKLHCLRFTWIFDVGLYWLASSVNEVRNNKVQDRSILIKLVPIIGNHASTSGASYVIVLGAAICDFRG